MSSQTAEALRPITESDLSVRYDATLVPSKGGTVSINPVEGRNYDQDTARYMTVTFRAREITKLLFDLATEEYKAMTGLSLDKIPAGAFAAVDPTAGIGGITKHFLEYGHIGIVDAYEIEDYRRNMLKHTLEDYGFDKNRYALFGEFLGIDPARFPTDIYPVGPVIHFDPPWTTTDVLGRQATKEHYILAGIKLGPLKMEEWVQRCWMCSAISVRGPPEYQMTDIPGFEKLGPYDLKNSGWLYVFKPKKGADAPPHIPSMIEPQKANVPLAVQAEELSFDLAELTAPSAATNVTLATGTTTITAPSTVDPTSSLGSEDDEYFVKVYGQNRQDEYVETDLSNQPILYNEWVRLLKIKIREILLRVAPESAQYVDMMLAPEPMNIWLRAFTDKSANPNSEFNYDQLEKYGDAVMGEQFIKYIMEKLPTVTDAQLTDLKASYVSKSIQGQISKNFGLAQYVRRLKVLTPKIHLHEDVLESFFGALVMASEVAFKNFTVGHVIAYNLIVYIYTPYDIKLKDAIKDPTNVVKEILEKVGLWYYEYQGDSYEDEGGDRKTVEIVMIKKTHLKMQESYIKQNLDRLIGEGIQHFNIIANEFKGLRSLSGDDYVLAHLEGQQREMSRKLIRVPLFKKAIETLASYGLTAANADQIQMRELLKRPEFVQYGDQLLAKLHRDGYSRMRFRSDQTDLTNEIIVTLLGITDGEEITTLVTAGGSDVQDAQLRTIRFYLSN